MFLVHSSSSKFFRAARDSLHLGQQVAELAVVDFDTVV